MTSASETRLDRRSSETFRGGAGSVYRVPTNKLTAIRRPLIDRVVGWATQLLIRTEWELRSWKRKVF